MPKILENVKEALLTEVKKQIEERGYKATTIRSVASECGVAVGTVYNYFPSKDMLIACFLLEDWLTVVKKLNSLPKTDNHDFLFEIYTELKGFAKRHYALFKDEEAAKVYHSAFSDRHTLLCSQLSDMILPLVKADNPEFAADFIAESLLTFTMSGHDFEEIYSVIKKIII